MLRPSLASGPLLGLLPWLSSLHGDMLQLSKPSIWRSEEHRLGFQTASPPLARNHFWKWALCLSRNST